MGVWETGSPLRSLRRTSQTESCFLCGYYRWEHLLKDCNTYLKSEILTGENNSLEGVWVPPEETLFYVWIIQVKFV